MSRTVAVNHTDTAISGVSSLTLSRGLTNFKADWKVQESSADLPNKKYQTVVTNLTSPLSAPEVFRFSTQDLNNVYSGSGVDPSYYAPTKQGVSLLSQLTEIWTVTDSADSSYRVDLPVSCHIVIRIPKNENITPAMVETLFGRACSGFYNTGLATTERLQAMLRGSTKPSDL